MFSNAFLNSQFQVTEWLTFLIQTGSSREENACEEVASGLSLSGRGVPGYSHQGIEDTNLIIVNCVEKLTFKQTMCIVYSSMI